MHNDPDRPDDRLAERLSHHPPPHAASQLLGNLEQLEQTIRHNGECYVADLVDQVRLLAQLAHLRWTSHGDKALLQSELKRAYDQTLKILAETAELSSVAATKVESIWEGILTDLSRSEPTRPHTTTWDDADPHREQDRRELRAVLGGLGYSLADLDSLAFENCLSGMDGISRLRFFSILQGGVRGHFVAKFDTAERAAKEWRAIRELSHEGCPVELALPLNTHFKSHRAALYRVVEGDVLADVLLAQLKDSTSKCVKALEHTIDTLQFFYQQHPGSHNSTNDDGALRWRHFFPKLADMVESLTATARELWFGVNWDERQVQLPELGRKLPNPFAELRDQLERPTGSIKLSRIHGDTNLTNIIVASDGVGAPTKVRIIDPANSRKSSATAIDFALMESEFWKEVYVRLTSEHPDKQLRAFAAFRDSLEGRRDRAEVRDAEEYPFHEQCTEFVGCLRRLAQATLTPMDRNYVLNDYFSCLYFKHIRSLAFPNVRGDRENGIPPDPAKAKIAILGAALALQVLRDSQLYPKGAENGILPRLPPSRLQMPQS